MDTSYSWHSGTDRVASRWAVPVRLLPDELLSTWLTRAALAQGCDPLVLTGELWPGWRVWTVDLDRGINDDRLLILEQASGVPVQAFQAASLRPIARQITAGSLDDLSVWPWILTLGARNRKRRGGLQYCPACLSEDRIPYLRLQWRLAWHTCCPHHQISLIDLCPHCGVPIEPQRLCAPDVHLAVCTTCKGELRGVEGKSPVPGAISFQEWADEVVKGRQGQYGDQILSAAEWFQLARYFVGLLRRAIPRQGLGHVVEELGVDVTTLIPPATGLALELLPVPERASLLAGAWHLLQAGPGRLLEACQSASLEASSLRGQQPDPPCIEALLQDLPVKVVARKRRGEMTGPRSQQAVRRMFARLKRKV